jgi:N-hydroxyarylamine O-acetyltransferase
LPGKIKAQLSHLVTMVMNIAKYIRRIEYTGSLKPTLRVLRQLQKQHLRHVPFENLDIHYGRKIILSVDNFFAKIIKQKRGGFCFELNGLFYALLSNLGFEVKMVSARVVKENGVLGEEFDHLVLLVQIKKETWLADVGFGDFSVYPLRLKENEKQVDEDGIFIISRFDYEYFKVSKFGPNHKEYKPVYLFSTRERQLSDFEAMCEFHQNSPESHFTQNKICSILTPDGRMTLTDTAFMVDVSGHKKALQISGEEAFLAELQHKFEITIDTGT